ncbi:Ribonuclease H-like superfamily protein [Pleurotus pulmonarius]
MRHLVRQLCDKEYQHLTLIKSMPIRWNTTFAEISRGILLRPAVNQLIEQLTCNVTGKQKDAASKLKRECHLSPTDWDSLSHIATILSEFNDTTIELSKSKEPTICKILPIYKTIETHLQTQIQRTNIDGDHANVKVGLQAGLAKLKRHSDKALASKYILLGAVLHPSFRLRWLEMNYTQSVADRAKKLLEEIFTQYKESSGAAPSQPAATILNLSKSFFDRVIATMSDSNELIDAFKELEMYFNGSYPCVDGNVLLWWKNHCLIFPILSRIARDILAIPGVSVSVERLFSSSKHTVSDTRSSLHAISASKSIVTKDWLKRGLGDGVAYLDGASIWNKYD